MSFKITQKKNSDHHFSTSFARKTKEVAKGSKSFFLYPKLLTILIILTVGMVTVRVYYSNQLAVSGSRVSLYESRANQLNDENASLENDISEKTALSYIESKATEMGMIKVDQIQVIKPLTPVAFNR